MRGRGRWSAGWWLAILLTGLRGSAAAGGLEDFEDELPAILAIEFIGNESVPASDLKSAMLLRFPSLAHPFRNPPRFLRSSFARELRLVEEHYRRHGFGGVAAVLDTVQQNPAGDGVRLRVRVREGPRTRIREVRFLPQSVFSLEELRRVVPFAVDDPLPFNAAELGRGTRALRLAFLTRGYLAVAVRDSVALDADSTAALLVYEMRPGREYTVRAVSISGNERTRAGVIQRELKIQPGQVYSYDLVEQSRRNLYGTALFRNVIVREDDPDSAAATVDLAVRVVERANRYVDGSVGVGRRDNFELNGSVGWGQRNLWGLGHGFEVRGTAAYNVEKAKDHYYSDVHVSYKVPRLHGWQLTLQPRGGFTVDRRQDDVRLQEWQLGLPFTWDLSHYTKLGFGATASLTTTTLEDNVVTDDSRETRLLFVALSQSATDDLFNPRTGGMRSIAVERAGFRGQNFFTRISGVWTHFKPLGRTVLALGLRTGWVEAYGASRGPDAANIGIQGVPFEYLYQAGGSSTVRGFDPQSLGSPLRVTQSTSGEGGAGVDTLDTKAGTVLLIGNVELRVPAPWLDRFGLAVGLFFDAGNVWEDFDDFRDARFGIRRRDRYTSESDMRYSTGFGLRYPTPFGPIRLDVGVPFKSFGRREFHFAVGHAF